MPIGTLLQFFLPRWSLEPIARLAGWVVWRTSRSRREQLTENARRIVGPAATETVISRTVLRTFQHLVMNYLDLLRVPVLRSRIVRLAEFNPQVLDAALAKGRGLVLVTAHVGNWDLAGCLLAALGYPTTAVIEPIPRGWSRTFNRYRRSTSMETIPMTDRHAIARALEQKRLLALVADRDLTGRGLRLPAFGAMRSYPRGPAAYALRYNVPIVVGWLVFQDSPGQPPYRAVVEPPIEFRPTGNTGADIDELTKILAERLNRLIATYPDQWPVFRAGWL